MQDYINRHVGIGKSDSPQDILGIVDVDIADDRKAEKTHSLLAMDHRDHAGVPLSLKTRDPAPASGLEHVLLHDRLERGQYEKKPQ
jgi:hypothetical protein